MQKGLITIGLIVVAIGLLWPWLSRLPLGRLPGDILIEKPGFTFYFPVTTSIVISIVVSALLWFFRR